MFKPQYTLYTEIVYARRAIVPVWRKLEQTVYGRVHFKYYILHGSIVSAYSVLYNFRAYLYIKICPFANN